MNDMRLINDILRTRARNNYPRTTEQSIKDHETLLKRIDRLGIKLNYVSAYLDKINCFHQTTNHLLSEATKYAAIINIKIDRLAKRNRQALLCWYTENWDSVLPLLPMNPYDVVQQMNQEKMMKKVAHAPTYDIDVSDLNQLLNYH